MKLVAVVIAVTREVSGWGQDGHRIVADIAHHLLNDPVKKVIEDLIPGETMVSVSTWADEADHTAGYAWSKCMHYIDSGAGMCSVNVGSDCSNGCCVVAAVANYTARIHDVRLPQADRTEALKFLVHLVGDSSQPLHAGHKDNQGGNAIKVYTAFAKDGTDANTDDGHSETNLHSVWDSVMLEEYLKEESILFSQFSTKIMGKIKNNHYSSTKQQWESACVGSDSASSCPLASAEESAALACEMAYVNEDHRDIQSGDKLSRTYYSSRMEVVEERLASAGVRLAAILNRVLLSDNAMLTSLLPEIEFI